MRLLICTFLIGAIVSGCGSLTHKPSTLLRTEVPNRWADLLTVTRDSIEGEVSVDQSSARKPQIRKTGLLVGASKGFVFRMTQHQVAVLSHEDLLDQIVQYQALMLMYGQTLNEGKYLLPGILTVRYNESIGSNDGQQIRLRGEIVELAQGPRLTTTVPDWRDELIISDYKRDYKPAIAALPNDTPLEIQWWQEALEEGWEQGVLTADQEMSERFRRLHANYLGMLRFVFYSDKNMLGQVAVAKTTLPVVGAGNQMAIDQNVVQITKTPSLNFDSESWTSEARPAPSNLSASDLADLWSTAELLNSRVSVVTGEGSE